MSRLGPELAAVALLCPIFLFAALWNGFPIVFFDTGAYVLEGFAHIFIAERSAVYSLFLAYLGGRESLWYVAVVQCLLTAFAVTEFARAVRPRTGLWELLSIGAALVLFTSVSWYAGQIEPDCMTAVLVLALYPLAFHLRHLGWLRAMLLVGVAAFATAAHPSHLGLSAGLVLSLVGLKGASLLLRRVDLPRTNVALPALSFVLGVGLVFAANYSLTHKLFVSRSGSTFLMARLMGDGIVKPTLDAVCPAEHFKLCAYKDRLPPSADAFLWGPESPFNELGRFKGMEKEARRITAESLARHPFASLGTGLVDAFRQFWMFRTGDGVTPQQWVLDPEFKNFMPVQYKYYLGARQQRGILRFIAVNVVHYPLALLSLVWLGFVLRNAARRRKWHRASLPAFVFLALVGNAMVCGLFSGPHDRYQSRLIWVPAFVLLLTERGNLVLALRRAVESGT
ncbi:MAG: hypothetical protein KGJ79_05935 [Alphaproteobacteria bacterium]|nr:hypothetical protein [Alphaproteobacteria bacterium]MDE2110662.1 hypothetical protein [Alphaproteobacteria bacterium]MDE2493087.1 hypothetical protein [Alphaproteobacteria bacterium]